MGIFTLPVLLDIIFRKEIDGTKVTFWSPTQTASTGSTRLIISYATDNKQLDLVYTFALVFATFSLYLLWKTCPFVQGPPFSSW